MGKGKIGLYYYLTVDILISFTEMLLFFFFFFNCGERVWPMGLWSVTGTTYADSCSDMAQPCDIDLWVMK